MKLKGIWSNFIGIALLAILAIACHDLNDDNTNKDNDARLESLTIADKAVVLGSPGTSLDTAEPASLTLSFTEASGVMPVIVSKSKNAQALYGKMKPGISNPAWKESGPLNLENGDYFVVSVRDGNSAALYYSVDITVPPPPPPPLALEDFRKKYITFADEIPVMSINTAGGVSVNGTSDNDYVNATISITGSKQNNISNWAVTIRGRGNSTWGMPKKPYRIRGNSRNNLFDRERVRNWALLANYADKSLMRNYIAHLLGRSLSSMEYIANVIFTEVYFNGSYEGLYCLQDHQESGPSRVNIEGFTKDGNGNLVETGFLLELDWPDRNPGSIRDRDYFSISNLSNLSGRYFYLKYPKYDDDGFEDPVFFQQAFNYVKNYVAAVHNAIDAHNMTAFENLCDKNTFIDYFLVKELTKDVDGAQLSVFFNKKIGEKMKMGPLWDFDLSCGNADYIDYSPQNWHVVRQYQNQQLPWFRRLMMHNDFYESFRTRYLELSETNIKYTIDSIDTIRELIRPAALRNFERWQILNSDYFWPIPPPVLAIHTWDGQVNYVKNFLSQRNAWMYDQLYHRRPIPGVR